MSARLQLLAACLLLLGPACGPGGATASEAESASSEEATSAPGTTTSTSSTDAGSESETDASETDTTSAETDTGEPFCGDGNVDPGEVCDGPSPEGAPCSDDCLHVGIVCGASFYDCGNTVDDDDDGLVDLDDPDCLSPCDHDEGQFSPRFPGGAQDESRTDCYWDDNRGAGDDNCDWDLRCDPLSPGAPWFPYDPNYPPCMFMQDQDPNCIERCLPLVPNGCDCFGCCEIDGLAVFLGFPNGDWNDPPCSSQHPEACKPCTIFAECFNPCDAAGCELCFMQTIDELAPGCREPACPDGVQSCASSYACPPDSMCQTGCCLGYSVN